MNGLGDSRWVETQAEVDNPSITRLSKSVKRTPTTDIRGLLTIIFNPKKAASGAGLLIR